ncbi:MAG: hypothetical protein AAGF11_18875 [Myxococcota bacterium]
MLAQRSGLPFGEPIERDEHPSEIATLEQPGLELGARRVDVGVQSRYGVVRPVGRHRRAPLQR